MAQVPLNPWTIETVALANTVTLVQVVGCIIEKVKEARAFKTECAHLANVCINLSFSYLEHKDTLKDVRFADEFGRCLQSVFSFVTQCTQHWSVKHIGWDLVVGHRLEALKKKLQECQQNFSSEMLMRINGNSSTARNLLSQMNTSLEEVKVSLGSNLSEHEKFLDQVRKLGIELEARRAEERSFVPVGSSQPFALLTTADPRVVIQSTASSKMIGTFESKPVVFEEVVSTGDHLPRAVKVYNQIGDITLIQKLYGIVCINGKNFAMMQSLQGHDSLANAIANGYFARLSFTSRIRFCYELSATTSALHENNLLIKCLSDEFIFMDSAEIDQPRPLVTGLRNARDIFGVTAGQIYDIRYEALETKSIGMHTRMYDVWCLGIILWQCFTESFPYGLRASDIEEGDNEKAIAQKIQDRKLPFDLDRFGQLADPLNIARACMATDTSLRPTASNVAQALYDILVYDKSYLDGEQSRIYHRFSTPPLIEAIITDVQKLESARRIAPHNHPSQSGDSTTQQYEKSQLDELARAHPSEALANYAVGLAYFWNLAVVPRSKLFTKFKGYIKGKSSFAATTSPQY